MSLDALKAALSEASNLSQFKGLSVAYGTFIGGIPTLDGYANLIANNNATNFGAGPGPIFNDENIIINTVNALYQGNSTAKSAFKIIMGGGSSLSELLTSVYNFVIPAASRSQAGLDYFKSKADFYSARATELGIPGVAGGAVVAFASLTKIAVDSRIGGIGDTLNDLISAVNNGTAVIPQSGTLFTPLETADGTQFDADDSGGGSTFTVQQVLDGAANGGAYHLADTLAHIVAAPTIAAQAIDYSLTNPVGSVGGIKVAAAIVVEGSVNQNDYDYSLTDSDAAIKGAPAAIIAEADTIAVVGTSAGEILDYRTFDRGVILNGNGGTGDILYGSAFNDAIYAGAEGARIIGGSGSNTIRLTPNTAGENHVVITGASGALDGKVDYISDWDAYYDKFVISSDDTTDSSGSLLVAIGGIIYPGGANAGVAYLTESPRHPSVYLMPGGLWPLGDLNAAIDGTELLRGLGEGGTKPATSISVIGNGQKAYIVAYQGQKAFLYWFDTGADSYATHDEIQLVAVISPDVVHDLQVWISQENFMFM